MHARDLATGAALGALLSATVAIGQAATDNQDEPERFKAYAVHDGRGYLTGQDVEFEPIEAEGLVLEITEDERLYVDLRKRGYDDRIGVTSGTLVLPDKGRHKGQHMVVHPAAGNHVFLAIETREVEIMEEDTK